MNYASRNGSRPRPRWPLANRQPFEAPKALREARNLPSGKRNPLFLPVRYSTPKGNGEVKRVHKLCCLRYLLDELDTCGTCLLEGCDLKACKRAQQVAR